MPRCSQVCSITSITKTFYFRQHYSDTHGISQVTCKRRYFQTWEFIRWLFRPANNRELDPVRGAECSFLQQPLISCILKSLRSEWNQLLWLACLLEHPISLNSVQMPLCEAKGFHYTETSFQLSKAEIVAYHWGARMAKWLQWQSLICVT